MTDEDRKFLEKALEEAFGKIEDPNKMMQEAVQQIQSPDRNDTSIITALEVIDKCCDDLDCARNVDKLGGIQTLLDLCDSHGGGIRIRTLEILALLFANNIKIQEVGIKRGALQLFVRMIKSAKKGSDERGKALRALVSLIRSIEAFEVAFLRQENGVALILECLDPEEDPSTREKAASFVRSLADDERLEAADVEKVSNRVAALYNKNLENETLQYREILASCASVLACVCADQVSEELQNAISQRLEQLEEANDPDGEQEMASLRSGFLAVTVQKSTTLKSTA